MKFHMLNMHILVTVISHCVSFQIFEIANSLAHFMLTHTFEIKHKVV